MPKNINAFYAEKPSMENRELAEFTSRVCETSDRKRLKGGSKTYSYGTITIRDIKLSKHIGKTVLVKVFCGERDEDMK